MQQPDSNVEVKAEFTAMWSRFADEHCEEMNAGDWLHLFGVLVGIMLSTAELDDATARSGAEAVAGLAMEMKGHLDSGMYSQQHLQ